MSYETIKVETRGRVGLLTFNRPKALNALSQQTMREVVQALKGFQADARIGAVVLTGSEKAFAAGADIKDMQGMDFTDALSADLWGEWEDLGEFRKPTVAAVAGYALGGGCEVALMCDIVIAADNAATSRSRDNKSVGSRGCHPTGQGIDGRVAESTNCVVAWQNAGW